MKPTRSRSRRVLTIGAEPSVAARQENAPEGQESHETRPTNEEAITRMAEFVAENPNIFEELGRYFKRQDKQKAESSKRKSDGSPEIPSREESDGRHSIRSTPKRASSKATLELPLFLRHSHGVCWGGVDTKFLAQFTIYFLVFICRVKFYSFFSLLVF